MSSSLLDFRGHHSKNHPGIKYSEMITTDEANNYRNGSIGDQNQNSIDCSTSDSACPLTTTVLLSHSGEAETKAMDYQSEDPLDFKVTRVQAYKYKKRSIILGGIAGMLLVTTIVLAVLLAVNDNASSNPVNPETEVCTSVECITAASRILNSMNQSVNPCEDFFTYSCGQWNRDHVIPDDKSSVSTFNNVRDSVSQIVKRVLETESSGDRQSIGKAKTYYSSCMDKAKIDSLGGKPALDIITEMGGMPLFGDPLSSFKLEEALAHSTIKYQSFALVSMWVSSDDMNSTTNIIQIDQPRLGMPNREYYLTETRRNATLPGYKQFMRDYLGKLWKDRDADAFDENNVSIVVNKIADLETELAEAMMASEDRRDSFAIYRKRTVNGMKTDITPDFDWKVYLDTAFSYVDRDIEGTREIVSYGDHYFTNFTKILSKYDDELIQNYIVWMVLRGRVSYLGKDYRDTQAPYRLAVSGTSQEQARWKTCSDDTNGNFLMPVGALFVKEAFPEENKDVTETMVENIRKTFIGFLPTNEWMDSPTKNQAEKKANMISPIIAYPDYILNEDDPKMDLEYDDIEIDAGSFFQNQQNSGFSSSKKYLMRLDVPVDRDEWITGPAIVNAFYSSSRNQIVFPAAILQPPFYDPGQPNSMNYGGIGMVIGHEITHGFDDSGSQYNGLGNLEDWWSSESRTNFNEKAKCMEDQYGNYYWHEAESNLNGKLTLGENIADNGGIREAYDAYQRWKTENDADLRLPGLDDFTHEQLFFLSMAQVWCGIYRPEYAARLVATDSHSPGIYRVFGSLSNFDKFGEAYGCARGQDAMYPNEEDTCRVW